jgi:hypothetical protein
MTPGGWSEYQFVCLVPVCRAIQAASFGGLLFLVRLKEACVYGVGWKFVYMNFPPACARVYAGLPCSSGGSS